MQLATEIQLLFDGQPLRIWRYGVPSGALRVHGKRTVRMLEGAERADLVGWHARTLDGAGLLQLDAPSYGTDGLADAWHLSCMQISLDFFTLYRAISPKLMLAPQLALAPQPTTESLRPDDTASAACQLQLSFHSLDGELLGSTSFAARLSVAKIIAAAVDAPRAQAQHEPRRVSVLEVAARPVDGAAAVELRASSWLPRSGMACAVLRQHNAVVLSTCVHFANAVGAVDAPWTLGEAAYTDVSQTRHREPLHGHVATGKVSTRTASVEDDAPAELRWRLEGPKLTFQIPSDDQPEVEFQPHACQAEWAAGLRQQLVEILPLARA